MVTRTQEVTRAGVRLEGTAAPAVSIDADLPAERSATARRRALSEEDFFDELAS